MATGNDPGSYGEPPAHVKPAVSHAHGGAPVVEAELVGRPYPRTPPPRGRRIMLPVFLFVATCISTLGVGGWKYMLAVMGILLAHEMGHFLQALRYRVPASLPFFIPMPLPPIGTMGAVIGMQGSGADRKELFDIGLTGPLAGLILAVPITIVGILTARPVEDMSQAAMQFGDPLLLKLLVPLLRPELAYGAELWMNPLLQAGWVGLLITGLNMLPVSQLDGGHVAYALLGRGAHVLARMMVMVAIGFIFYTQQYNWMLMLLLVMLIGTDHPPTADDSVPMGWGRWLLGLVSLLIPVFCLAPIPITMPG